VATITQSFDVKISIIRPYITKNLSDQDSSRIVQTTNLKYESLKTLTPQGVKSDEALPSDEEVFNYLNQSIAELDQLANDFEDIEKMADEALNKIVFTYDVEDPQYELVADAERAIFGSATGSITYSKYQKLLEFEQILNREIQERMVNNGGTLDVSA
jgi:hypothetical protein